MVPTTVEASNPNSNGHPQKATSNGHGEAASSVDYAPLELGGHLDEFKSFDVTPVIGREYKDVDIVSWLEAPNSNDLIRDLAIISEYAPLHEVRLETNLNVCNSIPARSRLLSRPRPIDR